MFQMEDRVTFGFSAENPTGSPNGGTRGGDCSKLRANIELAPGETACICDAKGEGMITHIWIGGDVSHSLILRMYWDGAETPSVEAPESAFFGHAYDETVADCNGDYICLNSACLLVAPCRGCNSYFEMPFRKGCRITVENRGQTTRGVYYMISGWYGKVPDNAGYFHAAYRQEHPVQKGRAYTVLDGVRGKGVFAGVTLAAGLNGHATCWVEGETKMYLDGDEYPTMNYTGTEDYFCGSYAFGNDKDLIKYQPFSGQYVGMYAVLGDSRERYNAQKRFYLYRWHKPDPIYFRKSFRMTFDDLGWTGPRYDDFTTVAYYYLSEPAAVPFVLPADNACLMT